MPSPAQLTNQALTFNLHVERETGSAPRSFFYVEANHEAGRERRAAVMGALRWWDCQVFPGGLESPVSF